MKADIVKEKAQIKIPRGMGKKNPDPNKKKRPDGRAKEVEIIKMKVKRKKNKMGELFWKSRILSK